MPYVLNTDGGARGNPGPAGAGFVLRDPAGHVIAGGGRFLGHATNNIAEYEALIDGVEAALARGVRELEVRCDSELVVKQIGGQYRVKNEGLKPLYDKARELLGAVPEARVVHVRREQNAEADALANEAMDASADVVWQPEEAPSAEPVVAAMQPAVEAPCSQTAATSPVQGSLFAAHGTWDLSVRSHFDAAHALRGYPGECADLHGHTWDVEVTVRGDALDEVGIVYDFKTLKEDLAAVLGPFDHGYLNDIPPFDSLNATAENLAKVVYETLAARLPAGIALVEVAVWESPIARIVYRRS